MRARARQSRGRRDRVTRRRGRGSRSRPRGRRADELGERLRPDAAPHERRGRATSSPAGPEFAGQAKGSLEMKPDARVRLAHGRAQAFEPVRVANVELGSSRLRQGFVGRVADELVAESHGVLPGERRLLRPDEITSQELPQHAFRVGTREILGESEHRAEMEDLALDGAMLEQGSLLRAQEIEPCRQQGLESGWEAGLHGIGAALVHMGQELLQKEGVPPCRRGDALEPDLLERLPGEGDQEPSALVGGQWAERQRGGVALASRPGRTRVEQLWACEAEEEDRERPGSSSPDGRRDRRGRPGRSGRLRRRAPEAVSGRSPRRAVETPRAPLRPRPLARGRAPLPPGLRRPAHRRAPERARRSCPVRRPAGPSRGPAST